MAQDTDDILKEVTEKEYAYGFITNIESDKAAKGLSEDIVRFISAKKNEPEWMLEWRLEAYRIWQKMEEPHWAHVHYPKIDYQNAYYYSAPKKKPELSSLDEADPELIEDLQEAGDFARRAEAFGRCGGGCGVRQREREDHVQENACRRRVSSSAASAKRYTSIPS